MVQDRRRKPQVWVVANPVKIHRPPQQRRAMMRRLEVPHARKLVVLVPLVRHDCVPVNRAANLELTQQRAQAGIVVL